MNWYNILAAEFPPRYGKSGIMLQTIEIFQELNRRKKAKYRAVRGKQQAEGDTPGQALDSLEKLLAAEERAVNSLVIVQRFQPDAFFSKPQQDRLQALMNQFRSAINTDATLSPEEHAELEQLIDAEWIAAIARAAAIIAQSDPSAEP
jgi:hypothetical protein